jgi:hypothetical protein
VDATNNNNTIALLNSTTKAGNLRRANRSRRAGPGTKLREHGLNVLTSNQTEGLGNPHSVSHLQPNHPPARNPPLSTRPNRSRRAEPRTKLREHGLNVPKVNKTEGLRNPHSVTRLQPNKPPARNPPLSDATKSLQARGDRDQAPTQMANHKIWENIPSGVHHTGPTTSRDIRTHNISSSI